MMLSYAFCRIHPFGICSYFIKPPCPLRELRGNQDGVSGKVGVPQRREKRFGNGVKNLSGSADIPNLLIIIIIEKQMLPIPRAIDSARRGCYELGQDLRALCENI